MNQKAFTNLKLEIHSIDRSTQNMKIQFYNQADSYSQEVFTVSLSSNLGIFFSKPELFV